MKVILILEYVYQPYSGLLALKGLAEMIFRILSIFFGMSHVPIVFNSKFFGRDIYVKFFTLKYMTVA